MDTYYFRTYGSKQLEYFVDYLENQGYIHYEILKTSGGENKTKVYGISESDALEIHSELLKIREKYPSQKKCGV